ncbi:MAG: hypothetical protein HYS27_26870 [Deltaproteobacteria bacterium]|nr:hypothetical protein [Deltaproteobacteria bacterium]
MIATLHRPFTAAVAALVLCSTAGCLQDDDLPATPVLDELPAVTSRTEIEIGGVAEYNARVSLTAPGATDGALTATADSRTGRFAIDLPLTLGDNAVSVTATDAAGNVSEAATVTITRQAPRAETVVLTLRDVSISADDGDVVLGVDVSNAEAGVDLTQVGVTLTITEDASFAPLAVAFNRVGHADVTLSERRVAGIFTVRAEADVADVDGFAAWDEVSFAVLPGAPINADFLQIVDDGGPHLAGDPVALTYQMADAWGNDATGTATLSITINAANVSIVDDGEGAAEIDGLVHAGSYLVRGHLGGSALADDVEPLDIEPNPELAGLNLVLSSSLAVEFGTITFSASDGFGNQLDQAAVTTTFSDPSAITRNGNQLTCNRPGSFSITACVLGTICDSEFVSVQGLLDTVAPTLNVTIEAPVATTEVVRNQRVVFRVDVTDDRALSELRYVATFGDNGACVRTGGPVLFSGTTAESRSFSFSVPNCAVPLDVVNLVAQATDQAGNTRNEADATLSILDPFQLTVPVGFLTTIAAYQDRLDGPAGIAVDEAIGMFYVADGNNDRAIGVPIDRMQFELRDQTNNRVDLRNVRGAAADLAGYLFFGVDDVNGGAGTSGIIRVSPSLVDTIFVDNALPGGQSEAIQQQQFVTQLAINQVGTPALCMVITSQDHLYCYGGLDTEPAAPTRLAELEVNGLRPRGIAIDPPGDPGVSNDNDDLLYVALNRASGGSRVIRRYLFNSGRTTLTQVVGGDLSLDSVGGIGDDDLADLALGPAPERNLYLADRGNGRVLRVERVTGTVTVFIDNLNSPSGVAFDGQSLLVTDDADNVVFRIVAADPGAIF